jgi:glycosyltransferase involved in cell wall biosynthesis
MTGPGEPATRHVDPLAKRASRVAWRTALELHGAATARRRGGVPRVFYGGARAGNIGGPLVKVQRLQQAFPERRLDYNLVYTLSNAPYLTRRALERLKRRKVPVVTNQNGVFYAAWYAGDWRAKNAEMATAYHLADHVFWQSDFCRTCADHFLGPREGAGELLYNAVDTGRFSPSDSRPERPFTFLATGKFGDDLFYRIDATLAGLAAARAGGLDARLHIAGWTAPSVAARMTARIAQLDLDTAVTATGPYTQAQAPDIYRSADAYVMLKHNDPCPNTVLEALACGLPVVHSRSGGVPELVGETAGIGLDVAESFEQPFWPTGEAVGAAMIAIAEGHEAAATEARARAVARFDIAHWLYRHRQVFQSLLGRSA